MCAFAARLLSVDLRRGQDCPVGRYPTGHPASSSHVANCPSRVVTPGYGSEKSACQHGCRPSDKDQANNRCTELCGYQDQSRTIAYCLPRPGSGAKHGCKTALDGLVRP